MHIGYLYSRYPVISQTFCDTEMIALERLGHSLHVGSIYPPHTSSRHAHAQRLTAPVDYAPPQQILQVWEEKAKAMGRWPAELIQRHDRDYGTGAKAALRARNALYFAHRFAQLDLKYFHVHFANRAAHTALFVKAISGIRFGVTAHGQDFMVDLGNEGLLQEICAAAAFVAAETDYSTDLLRQRCPGAADKIHRVYNGMDLANFPSVDAAEIEPGAEVRILSVGRLVPFKGFLQLIDGCGELTRRQVRYSCEIVGDGPLREQLAKKIADERLTDRITLSGSLTQEQVFEKVRRCDVFALPCIEADGASDVFPTVILEAMASSRPVVSTRIAGVPESVCDGSTGLLVPPRDASALADALQRLATDPALRRAFGRAGRSRVEENFQVAITVKPLETLMRQEQASAAPAVPLWPEDRKRAASIAYLIDCWPDPRLPELNEELRALRELHLPVQVFVCEVATGPRLDAEARELALEFEYLPDAIVIEAEWQENRTLARGFEDDRARSTHRTPAALFLRQARFAVMLRKLLEYRGITFLHATSSRALVCGALLKTDLDLPLSVSIERDPELAPEVLRQLLSNCIGGRVSDSKFAATVPADSGFEQFRPPRSSSAAARVVKAATGFGLTKPREYWQQWSAQLAKWGALKDE